MDYEEKYKKAVEKLDKLLNLDSVKESGKVFADVVRGIFPELQESEDERIRKELLSFVKGMLVCHDKPNAERDEKYESWIAWLEKQRKKDEEILVLKDQIESLHAAIKATKNVHKIELEKLGFTSQKECDGHNQMVSDPIMSDDDKSQQKPADKAKSKFKVGDFIVDYYCRGRVVELTEDSYLLDTGQGIPFSCEHNVHLWTVQDAKDGDILCTYECCEPKIVFILKGTPKKHYALSYHCYYNIMYPHFSPDSEKGCLAPNDEDVKPATKEQRDLLFQKMKEAGYEWDADKKELKKIEQKQVIDYSDSLSKDKWELIHEFVDKFGRIPKDEDELNVLVEYVLKRQKLVLGEEDEKTIKRIDSLLHAINESDFENIHAWLKSLKDRIQPQPKKEWSEEDEIFVNGLIRGLSAKRDIHGHTTFSSDCIDITETINWLKSLRPHKQWKPSDEQMVAINTAINVIGKGTLTGKRLIEIQEHLSELKGGIVGA